MSRTFDPARFEAEVALRLIPTEQLPTVAQDALEAGFDGPHVVRMAILDPRHLWAIDQALPPMLEELGRGAMEPREAALRLARRRAEWLLQTGEDPLPSLPYFHRLLLAADYPNELVELAYLEDEFDFLAENNVEARRVRAHGALEDLLSPELAERRRVERGAAWERKQARISNPSRKNLTRLREWLHL